MKTILELLPNPTPFLQQIFGFLQADGIEVSRYELDHICYRVATQQRYEELKKQLLVLGELLTEKPISGRPIATFKLEQPILFNQRKIELLELPAPKPNRFYAEGYEHVEFVIDMDLPTFAEKYPNITFDKKGMGKEVNPDLRLNYGELSVKFHEHNLAYVIAYLDE